MVEEFTEEDWEELLPATTVRSPGSRYVRYVLAFAALCLGSTAIVIGRSADASIESSVSTLLPLYAGITVLVGICWWAETRLD